MKTGISKNVPHAYIEGGIRYYAFIQKFQQEKHRPFYNFYVFDEDGYVWCQMIHVNRSGIFQLGNGFFYSKSVFEVSEKPESKIPLIESDIWINGSPDRGYALEIIREGLGLNLEYLTALMENESI